MKIYKYPQGSDEWFEVRLGKLTASTAQAIATNGKGLETLCFEKVAERMTGKMKEQYTNLDMERGKELEYTARSSYELEAEDLVKEVGFVELNEYIGCSPDGFVGADGLVEIKCPNDTNFTRYLYDKKIDPKYWYQMQMQMYVTDREWVDYVVYNQNYQKHITERVVRDQKAIKKITDGLDAGVKKMEEIWQRIQ
jgi:exodeoxyribonuclease (lambda-induced)